jgi:hypothetical protein
MADLILCVNDVRKVYVPRARTNTIMIRDLFVWLPRGYLATDAWWPNKGRQAQTRLPLRYQRKLKEKHP